MTALPPFDPDALNPLDVPGWTDEEWHEAVMLGYRAGRRGRLAAFVLCALSGAVIGAAIAVVLTSAAYAASRSGSLPLEDAGRSGVPRVVSHMAGPIEVPPFAQTNADDGSIPRPPAEDPPPAATTIRGTATWYCASRSACTHGYGPSDLVAAIDPTLGIPKGTRLTVTTASGRSVTVRVVDVCACAGPRIIDLTSGAFRRLAPLSRGKVQVTISTGGPLPTVPGTDTP